MAETPTASSSAAYRDDLEAARARIRTLSAELEAEREKRQAADASCRAADAALDELRQTGGPRPKKGPLTTWQLALLGIGFLTAIFLPLWLFISPSHEPPVTNSVHMSHHTGFTSSSTSSGVAGAPQQGVGYLNISAFPPSTVYIDGERVGKTPIVGLKLDPGTHQIRIEGVNGDETRTVEVTGGQTMSLSFMRGP